MESSEEKKFLNEESINWISKLLETQDFFQLREALDRDSTTFLEYNECCNAVAAAEIAAQLAGFPATPAVVASDEIEKLAVKVQNEKCKKALVKLALEIIAAIMKDAKNSALRAHLEKDPPTFKTWLRDMNDLESRLKLAISL